MNMVSRHSPAVCRCATGARLAAISGALASMAPSSCAPVELPGDPVQVYRPRESRTNCQRLGTMTHCQTSYQ